MFKKSFWQWIEYTLISLNTSLSIYLSFQSCLFSCTALYFILYDIVLIITWWSTINFPCVISLIVDIVDCLRGYTTLMHLIIYERFLWSLSVLGQLSINGVRNVELRVGLGDTRHLTQCYIYIISSFLSNFLLSSFLFLFLLSKPDAETVGQET